MDGRRYEPHGPRQFEGTYVNEYDGVFLHDGTCKLLARMGLLNLVYPIVALQYTAPPDCFIPDSLSYSGAIFLT